MPNSSLDKRQVTTACRVLSIHPSATLAEVKKARDRLAKLYHPDKHPNLTPEELDALQIRFNAIQESYEFVKKNHSAIQVDYANLSEFSLTYKGHQGSRAHWIYSAVSQL